MSIPATQCRLALTIHPHVKDGSPTPLMLIEIPDGAVERLIYQEGLLQLGAQRTHTVNRHHFPFPFWLTDRLWPAFDYDSNTGRLLVTLYVHLPGIEHPMAICRQAPLNVSPGNWHAWKLAFDQVNYFQLLGASLRGVDWDFRGNVPIFASTRADFVVKGSEKPLQQGTERGTQVLHTYLNG